MPHLLGQTGIALAQPVADILSFVLTIFLVKPTVNELKRLSIKKDADLG